VFDKTGAVSGALFQRGYGLSGTERHDIGPLSEDPGLSPAQRQTGTLFTAGHVVAPWSVYVRDALGEVRMTLTAQSSPDGSLVARLEPAGLRASWSGKGAAELRIGGRASDLRAALGANAALTVRYRVNTRPVKPVRIGLTDATPVFATAPLGAWTLRELPLRCFAEKSAEVSAVNGQFVMETAGPFDVSISDVRFAAGGDNTSCP
jgi:beta-glucosidase